MQNALEKAVPAQDPTTRSQDTYDKCQRGKKKNSLLFQKPIISSLALMHTLAFDEMCTMSDLVLYPPIFTTFDTPPSDFMSVLGAA